MRLHPLLAGEIRIARDFYVPPDGALGPYRAMLSQLLGRDTVWAPVPVFLVEHPQQGPVLVDTGYAADAAGNLARTMGRASATLFDHRPYDLDVLLERAGVRAADIRTVVMTHLHNDHVAGCERLRGATFVADRREWLAGDRGGIGLSSGGYVPALIRSITRREIVDFDGPRAAALGPFERSIDLFGDGSVILIATPGHTPGHQSVLVRLGGGREVLLTGDAADLRSVIERPERTSVMSSEAEFLDSLGRIHDFAAANPDTVVIPGHDPQFWPTLEPVYGG
jgi:N-acyl homoserine lactone hydrolase